MTLLNGATMHNLTNLRDGGLVTFVALPSCHLCRLGYGPNSEFPVDGKRCGGCRAVYYCNKVGVVVLLVCIGCVPTNFSQTAQYIRTLRRHARPKTGKNTRRHASGTKNNEHPQRRCERHTEPSTPIQFPSNQDTGQHGRESAMIPRHHNESLLHQ
jgi:hypothetical protein